jgi:TolB protein
MCHVIRSITVKLPTDDSRFEYSLLSTGKGRTTCSYFLPGNDKVIICLHSCKSGYLYCPIWIGAKDIYGECIPVMKFIFQILNGNIVLKQLTDNNYYDAEAVVSPNGDKILFTSNRSGDLRIMDYEP